MVFQSYALYPHMTVAENMGFSLRLAGVPKAERDAKVLAVARTLHLEPLLGRKPKELSGGQRQRVAIGRAIVRQPGVFLFDEPLSNLDASLRVKMRIEISRLHEELATTIIYVTHDQVEAMTMADKIVVLQAGVIEQVGSPLELYHHPRNRFVAGFIGSPTMNFRPAAIDGLGPEGVSVALPGGSTVRADFAPRGSGSGQGVTLGVRPEHLALADDGQIRGEVLVAERLGGQTFLHVRVEGGDLLTVQADGNTPARVHDRVGIRVDEGHCHLFTEADEAVPHAHRNPLADEGRPAARRTSPASSQMVEEAH